MVPDLVRPGAQAGVWMQNPGEQEEAEGVPAVGKTGQMQDRDFLPKAGLTREEISIFNAIRCRVDGSNELPDLGHGKESNDLKAAISHCTQAHWTRPPGLKAVIATGDKAVYAASGGHSGSAEEWRGWAFPLLGASPNWHRKVWTPGIGEVAVLATHHSSRLFHQPLLRPIVLRDWGKLARILKGTWPRPLPPLHSTPPATLPRTVSFDTEYSPHTGVLSRYSMATRDRETWVVEAEAHVPTAVELGGRIVTQNAPADIGHFSNLFGWSRETMKANLVFEDIMLKHAVLYAGYPHDLDFQGSLYASINRWKHLSELSPREYSGGDALGTIEVDTALSRELLADPLSKIVYEQYLRPHIWTIERAHREGMATHKDNVGQFIDELSTQLRDAELMGQAAVGWPINLGSGGRTGMVARELYDVLKLPTKKGRD